jgi:hypothetical protein
MLEVYFRADKIPHLGQKRKPITTVVSKSSISSSRAATGGAAIQSRPSGLLRFTRKDDQRNSPLSINDWYF